jgi:hypothetical protein
MEAIAFACLLALAQAVTGAEPLPLTTATLALIGTTLVLLAALRETGSETRGTAVVVGTLGAGALVAILLPTRPLDVVGWIGRLILFVILAEIYLWRVLSVARGAIRWSDARNAVPTAALAIAAAATVPLPVDRGPLVPLSLIFVAASAVALSVARSTEELSVARGKAGQARISSANSVVFALGVTAILAAAMAPLLQHVLADVGATFAPVFDQLLFYLLLPLGYLAAALVAILEPLLRRFDFALFRPGRPLGDPAEDAALMREIERARPFVIGGMELLVAIVVILVALVLLERAVRERRLALPDGAQLERTAASGLTLGDTLRSLLPRRPSRRRPPRDDGTPSAALRLVYWRLLELAERAGHGWREAAETPAEHQLRLSAKDARWTAAAPVVAAFEDLRYGEVAPDRGTVDQAQQTLRSMESALRT